MHAMRIPLGGRQKNEGHYGGMGSRPGAKHWTPTVHKEDAPSEKVPRKFRGLRLRRRRSRMEPTPAYMQISLAAIVLGFLWLVIALILG